MGEGVGKDKGGGKEGAEVDFVVAGLGALDNGEHNERGEKVGEEKSDESEPGLEKNDGDRGGEEPVAVANPAAFGDEVEDEVGAAKDEYGE